MNLFGFTFGRKALSLDEFIRRLEAVYETVSGISVTPDTCMQSPTVHAVVTAISRRIATLPVHVMQSTTSAGRTRKERRPNHPVERLLNQPNDWQTRVSYWLDSTSWLVRWGNHYAFKARGATGPIRRLVPLPAGNVTVEQLDDLTVVYRVQQSGVAPKEYKIAEMHHARGAARDGVQGDSPVTDIRESIALEIAAERLGSTFFANGAMPGIVLGYADSHSGHRNDEERRKFVDAFQEVFAKREKFRAVMLPKGIKVESSVPIENDKAQFLETRSYQRTVIAGAFGVPPHLVGDLERGTFNNVEQQSLDFVQAVVLPYVRIFESAMERDLLTDDDRRAGVIIRFNLDGALRGDFKTRQEGLKIQREAGVISPNDWRENENMNPISEEDGGETYWQEGPSGQGGTPREGNDDDAAA